MWVRYSLPLFSGIVAPDGGDFRAIVPSCQLKSPKPKDTDLAMELCFELAEAGFAEDEAFELVEMMGTGINSMHSSLAATGVPQRRTH